MNMMISYQELVRTFLSAMGQGAWHEANMSGDKIDHGGCVNTLTTLRPSPLAKGNPQHTNLVEIEKI